MQLSHGDLYTSQYCKFYIYRTDLISEDIEYDNKEEQHRPNDELWVIGGLNGRKNQLYSDLPRTYSEMCGLIFRHGWDYEGNVEQYVLWGAL